MMGLFLQYDLGIMENVLWWFQGLKTHIKVHATLSKAHMALDDTCDTYQGACDTFTTLVTLRVRYLSVEF
jgi:hypothetical protein